ncbi:MAG: hypothetical protein K5Q00_05005 [Gammaproteobacteria bacterium]|nr:hypothetical protein [Gammaproteobacteria bacterium]
MSNISEHYANEQDYAFFINYKREQYPDLLERVEIKTPLHIVEQVKNGIYDNIDEKIEHSLAYDTLRIMAANLW